MRADSALDHVNDLTSILESVVTVLAVVVGGWWAYFKFVKERVYRPRFDIAIEAERVTLGGRPALWWRLSVKNIGAGEIRLLQRGTGLRLSDGERPEGDHRTIRWSVRTVFPVFEEHAWIESGETIRHESLVSLPDARAQALRLEARLVCEQEPTNVSVYSVGVFPPDRAGVSSEGEVEMGERGLPQQGDEDSGESGRWEDDKEEEGEGQALEDPAESQDWEHEKQGDEEDG